MARQLRSGPGWRVGWDDSELAFPALVGADDWAIELTQAEFGEFCRFALAISDAIEQMRSELMEEEAIACETSSDQLWMEVRGYPDAYELSFMVLTGRRTEGCWSVEATKEVLRAVQMVQVF
jgi:hypothetical protein